MSARYQPYVDYALANKIIAEVPKDLNRPATRAEFASMLAAALPEKELEAIHEDVHFVDVDIPDFPVKMHETKPQERSPRWFSGGFSML